MGNVVADIGILGWVKVRCGGSGRGGTLFRICFLGREIRVDGSTALCYVLRDERSEVK